MPNIPGAPAHLVLLPSASKPPVVQAPRRGRYPRGVISLRQARENARRRECFQRQLYDMSLELAHCQGGLAALHMIFDRMEKEGVMA